MRHKRFDSKSGRNTRNSPRKGKGNWLWREPFCLFPARSVRKALILECGAPRPPHVTCTIRIAPPRVVGGRRETTRKRPFSVRPQASPVRSHHVAAQEVAELAEGMGACRAERRASTGSESETAAAVASKRARMATCREGVGDASAAAHRHVPANHRRAPCGCPAGATSARQLFLTPARAV